ncbi:MAG TPA: hypothetical protein VEO01_37965 [Pseudonocardiaceae bacterium]|nr:hypothetical protein [Pseudonocardiaceae bacterium]
MPEFWHQFMRWLGPTIEQHWDIKDHLSTADMDYVRTRIEDHEQRLNSLRTELAIIRRNVQQSVGAPPQEKPK